MKNLVVIFTMALLPFISQAQVLPPAFNTCPSTGFQVQGTPTQFQTVNLATGTATTVATYVNTSINAIGFNPNDRRIYGIRELPSLALVAIGSDYTNMVVPTTGALFNSVIGDISPAGILWCLGGGMAGRIFTVNCNSADAVNFGVVTNLAVRPTANIADLSFPPNDNTRMYSVTSAGSLIYISTTSPYTTTMVMPDGTVAAATYGTTYFDGSGNFYAKANGGGGPVYKFTNLTSGIPAVVTFSTSSNATASDGARCATAPPPIIGDFGDAPDSYGTSASAGGASHQLPTAVISTAQIYFGPGLTLDADATPASAANTDTDDGITSFTTIAGGLNPPPIPSYNVTINAHNTSTSVSNISGWIDWNTNGVFDAPERAVATAAPGYIGPVVLTWNNVLLSGITGTTGTYGRFRISSADVSSATGSVANGEVEDYPISFLAALPITITSFAAVKANSLVHLNWVTSSEKNNKGFAIERSSDGVLFEQLDFVPSQAQSGNSDQKLTYTYYDKKAGSGEYFYRLKQTDYDGVSKYSIIAKITVDAIGNAVIIYPNPARDEITIDGLKGNEVLFLFNEKGELIKKQKANGALSTLKINTVKSGIYMLKITDAAGNSRTRKIVKQ